MKIDNLKINGFGKINYKDIKFENGINIIRGDNETGKSTILKFICAMLYGISKNKGGKNISDFDRYTPWDGSEFSGKIRYILDNSERFEVYREFRKKSPIIYNKYNEDISSEFKNDKTNGIAFFQEQTGIDEKTFYNTAVISQKEVKIEKNDTNIIVQKISNLVSTGNDNISYKKSMEKLNKMQNDYVGSDRTRQKPINVVNKKIQQLLYEKRKLVAVENNKEINEKQQKDIVNKITELKYEKEKIKEDKLFNEDINVEKVKKCINIYTYLLIIFSIICVLLIILLKNFILDIIAVIPVIVSFILMKRKSNKDFENIKISNQELINNYEKRSNRIQDAINQLSINLNTLEIENNNLDKNLEKLSNIESNLREQYEIKEELNSLNASFNLAKECLEKAYSEVKHNLSPKFERNLCEITSEITDGIYKNIKFNEEIGLNVEIENGAYMPIERFSVGTIDEMYLALRLSTISLICEESLPIILDETFAYFDSKRLKNMICYLQDKYYDNQIIIFTCSEREEQILNELRIEYNLITLEKS